LHSPNFGNDETRLGGAFSYDGGGLDPEAHTPKLVFERVVFDRNQAVSAAAVWIAGRVNTMSSLDLVVDGCLFFRNAAAYCYAGLAVWNTMPGTLLVNNSDFSENSGFLSIPINIIGVDAKVGVQDRRNTGVIANSHVDGGGIWTYAAGGPFVGNLFAPTADGAIHDFLFERVTVVDIIAVDRLCAIFCGTNNLRETHCAMRECRVARAVGVEGDGQQSEWHSAAIFIGAVTTAELSRFTLEASGSFVDESRGQGALRWPGIVPYSELKPGGMWLKDSIFLRNQAARGGAIAIFDGGNDIFENDVIVQRCFFEVGASYNCRPCHRRAAAARNAHARRATWRQ
jgi:hypothetical protein